MSKTASLLFAIVAYAVFLATFLYLIVFNGNLSFGELSLKTVDNPPSDMALGAAVVVNVALIALFGVQHSVMARQGFKRAWTKVVPPPIERSVYVLMASLALIILFKFWQPIPSVVWDVSGTVWATLLWAAFAAGWVIVLLSTFLINHFELFGLQQAWFHMSGRTAAEPQLHQPMLYKWVAHPLYSGFFLAFWATPRMTAGHLLLAIGVSIYMLIAIRYEERDLHSLFGPKYQEYRSGVGMLTPRFRRKA